MRQTTLSMTSILRQLPSPLFTTADAAKFVTDENVFLFRAGRKGYVKRIANRVYWNALFSPQPPAVEMVACFARRPSYVSGEWALNYHGVLLQVPTVCTAVTLHRTTGRRNRIFFSGCVIEYSRISERLYLPDQVLSLDGFLMATPEKALLDTIYLRRRVPFGDELEQERLDRERIKTLAALFPAYVIKHLDSLLNLQRG